MNVSICLGRAEIFKIIVDGGNRIAAVEDEQGRARCARWHASGRVFRKASDVVFVELRVVASINQGGCSPGRSSYDIVRRGSVEDEIQLLWVFYDLIEYWPDLYHGLGSSKWQADKV